ncbi:MAG: retropepsin-like domain-containing protein [Nanoarchaeota archaeon]|nr:retropepsin-like domain-containing protein [Nanoarchaeota archaeon]MBU1051902.1 retropepsin-like domain-containing protein [Nanoarchaeota archaeon]MBU1988945.1 retropepsin-like domain-containing protein [Nanoarchaeota archaeon]
MTISFKYKSIKRPDKREVKTPSIPVMLKGRSPNWVEFVALLDSGADLSVVPQDVAELLDLDLSGKKDRSSGIGGDVEVINTRMQINVKKKHEDYTFEIPVQVILGESKVPILLGREGFFEQFKIIFEQGNERVRLKKIAKTL